MKKALSICLFLSLMAGCLLTGCDRTSTANSSSVAETTAATTATEAVTEAETTAEESEAEETEAETETTAEESADAEDAETTTAAKEKDTSKDGNLWADFDNMSFKINGKTYTLGKTTLQEMIDDGVPFDENDLANAGNNINPRYESSSFEIKLGERSFAQVRVLNDSSDNKKASECFIDNVYMPIYDEPQDILEFNFPLTMTQEELLALIDRLNKDDHVQTQITFILTSRMTAIIIRNPILMKRKRKNITATAPISLNLPMMYWHMSPSAIPRKKFNYILIQKNQQVLV